MYNIIGDYIAIVSTFNKSEIRSKSGKTVNSLIQVKHLSEEEFGTIIPEALYYKIKQTDTKEEKSNEYADDSKKISNDEERVYEKIYKKKNNSYVDTITIYRYLNWENDSKTRIQAIPIYKVFLINFSAIPFEEQINFFRRLANKHDNLLFAYLISFVTKSELILPSSNLFKKKKDAIEHLFYNACLPIEINDKYSTTLCMVARNSEEAKNVQTTMVRSIVLKASEITFKERLFSDIDEWDFFHRYSFNKFYRFINFFLYSKIKWITYFIIIPLVTVFLIIGLNHILYLLMGINFIVARMSILPAGISKLFAKDSVLFAKANAFFINVSTSLTKMNSLLAKKANFSLQNHSGILLQSIIILFATILILFYVLDAHISGAQKKEAHLIKNVF